MVVATLIAITGTLSETSIPAKTADVLEWLRKKLKQPTLQFQGKCVHEEYSFAFFAVPSEVEDEQTNQHMLPPPFHDDSFQGSIAVLKSANPNPDDYDRQATQIVSGFCSSASFTRVMLIRSPTCSSIHILPPPAPQQNALPRLRSISTGTVPVAAANTSRGAS